MVSRCGSISLGFGVTLLVMRTVHSPALNSLPHGKDQSAEAYQVLGEESQVRQRIDHQALRFHPFDLREQISCIVAAGSVSAGWKILCSGPFENFFADFDRLDAEEIGVEENAAGFCQVDEILFGTPDGDIEASFPPPDPFGDELQREGRFPGPGAAGKEVHLSCGESTAEDVVKAGDAGRQRIRTEYSMQ